MRPQPLDGRPGDLLTLKRQSLAPPFAGPSDTAVS